MCVVSSLGGRSLPFVKREAGSTVQFRDVDPGAGHAGRARLLVDAPGVDRLPVYRALDTPGFPLTLITPATSRTTSSMFGHLAPASPDLRLSRADAEARGLRSGGRARITDGKHAVEATVRVDDTMRPGVAAMPKGMWRRDGYEGFTANVFAPDHLADLAGGATFNDARVEVTAI